MLMLSVRSLRLVRVTVDSLGDKVLLLKCYTTELPFSRDKNSFAMMDRMIEDALPAFAHFLDNYEIPEDIRTGLCRFGFDEYHHPDLAWDTKPTQ